MPLFQLLTPHVRERFEKKREEDMADIDARMHQIEVERSYRIVGKLEQTAKDIKNKRLISFVKC